ncbi:MULTISPECIES: hypothetical protein [unclassified Shimia]|uniref:hypothetical protein n=1 Tax=unclassified Shimia TaxID=2630038 RepID=UPI0031035F1D
MKTFITNFRKDEAGAVTVDWVVLTAGVVGLAVAAFAAIESVADAPVTAAAITLNTADASSSAIATE